MEYTAFANFFTVQVVEDFIIFFLIGSSSVSLWEDINSSMQKLDPLHIEIVEYATEYRPADYSRLEDDSREYLVREYPTTRDQEYIKAEPGKEQDFIALVNDSIGYCYDTSHQVRILYTLRKFWRILL